MKKLRQIIIAFTLVLGIGFFVAPQVGAINALATACTADKSIPGDQSTVCASQNDNVGTITGVIVNMLLFLIGLAAVVVIIIGGLRYTLSAGREKEVEEAKNMILYAVIGLVIAFLAYAVVNWVLHAFGN